MQTLTYRVLHPTTTRYLLYWYKSANADVLGATPDNRTRATRAAAGSTYRASADGERGAADEAGGVGPLGGDEAA